MEDDWTQDDIDTANDIFARVQTLKAMSLAAQAEAEVIAIDTLIQAQMTRHGMEIPL